MTEVSSSCWLSYGGWPQFFAIQASPALSLVSSKQGRAPLHKTDVTVSCNIIMYIQSHMSHHLCCILLFRSKSQVLPTFKGRYYTKACLPGGGDYGTILGLSTTMYLFFSLLLLLYIGLKPSTGNSSKVLFLPSGSQ